MASSEDREAIRAGRRDVKAKFVAAPKAPTSPLEDVQKQDEILNPLPMQATIGGEPVEIHELSARHSRALTGLAQTIVSDLAFDAPRINGAMFGTRLAGLVAEKYSERIMPFIVRSTELPGEIKEADVPSLVEKMLDSIKYEELVVVLVLLLNANRVLEALTPQKRPKNG